MRNFPVFRSTLKVLTFGSTLLFPLLAMTNTSVTEDGVSGDFVIIGVRTASDVAGLGLIPDDRFDSIGSTVSFGETLIWVDGTRCDDWSLEVASAPIVLQEDPILSDLQVPPVDVAHSAGDQRENIHYNVRCGGEYIGALLKVDDRTLVVPHVSGRTNVVLERSLTASQIKDFQTELKSMKFYHSEPNGILDESTRSAAAAYADYRGAEYVFKDAAITENLLDGLYVLP